MQKPLLNGVVQSVEAMGDQNASFCTSRAPRTARGFDENNNVVISGKTYYPGPHRAYIYLDCEDNNGYL